MFVGPTSSARACSGDMYETVPMIVPAIVSARPLEGRPLLARLLPAAPSASPPVWRDQSPESLIVPLVVTIRFSGLMSL